MTNPRVVWAICTLGLLGYYTATFLLTSPASVAASLTAAAANVGTLALAAVLARAMLKRLLSRLVGWRLLLVHLLLAAFFSLLWAWLLVLINGIFLAGSPSRFSVAPFVDAAQRWQWMQGLFAYTAIAALTLVEARPAGSLLVLDDQAAHVRERLLVQDSGDITSISVNDIVSIIGADDYSEVITLSGRHLASTTLTAFEAALDPTRFVRVHRSAIANLGHIARAAPVGGGRMNLSMRIGPDLPVSRTGARVLRTRTL